MSKVDNQTKVLPAFSRFALYSYCMILNVCVCVGVCYKANDTQSHWNDKNV